MQPKICEHDLCTNHVFAPRTLNRELFCFPVYVLILKTLLVPKTSLHAIFT